jgi:3-phenylpropionate/cinnamic acid dioxygenase small subunit
MVSHAGAERIRALIYEYAFRLDAGDFDGVAELFANAELTSSTHSRVRRGAAEARELYEDVIVYDDGTPRTMHQLTNVTISTDDDGTHATARTYFTVLAVTAQGLHPILGGEYQDTFVKVADEWRFASRHFVPMLIGDLSGHMRR